MDQVPRRLSAGRACVERLTSSGGGEVSARLACVLLWVERRGLVHGEGTKSRRLQDSKTLVVPSHVGEQPGMTGQHAQRRDKEACLRASSRILCVSRLLLPLPPCLTLTTQAITTNTCIHKHKHRLKAHKAQIILPAPSPCLERCPPARRLPSSHHHQHHHASHPPPPTPPSAQTDQATNYVESHGF